MNQLALKIIGFVSLLVLTGGAFYSMWRIGRDIRRALHLYKVLDKQLASVWQQHAELRAIKIELDNLKIKINEIIAYLKRITKK